MGTDEAAQLEGKVARLRQLLGARGADAVWLDPVASAPSGFRAKAKMVVGGSVTAPTLGILDAGRRGVDLSGCGVLDARIRAVFPALKRFIATAALVPYDVGARRGELKHVLVTVADDGALMVRFVLRSTEALSRIRKHLPALTAAVPQLTVVSANLQPLPAAIIEGPDEVVVTQRAELPMRHGDVVLHIRPASFVQTNTAIATALYAQAAEWVDAVAPQTVWDLYCGAGGFALAVSGPGRDVVGVEASGAAVESAERGAVGSGVTGVRFEAADATEWALTASTAPDVVIVNPPRRGIGARLASWLEQSSVETVVYSSCNPVTLARDLESMPSYAVDSARVFDMFPQTRHVEAMVLLRRA